MTEEERAVSADNGRLALPAIVVHGGAGRFDRVRTDAHVERIGAGLSGALDAGWAVLSAGGSAVDAVVEAVAYLEDSGRFNAGRGSVTTSDGSVEFDASVMNASTGRVGAILMGRRCWPERARTLSPASRASSR
jgi:beta-aspartyl-peptidase (threonine type)